MFILFGDVVGRVFFVYLFYALDCVVDFVYFLVLCGCIFCNMIRFFVIIFVNMILLRLNIR